MEFWQNLSFTETDQLIELAQIAEEVGYAGIGLAEHLVTPEVIQTPYPHSDDGKVWWDPNAPFPDPWVTMAVLASHTTRLRFATTIYVLPMHEMFSAAKAISTAAFLSNNRMILGLGVGWMADEFWLTGQDFHTRGKRTDEMLEVMAKLWAGGMVEHHGRFYDFPRVQMSPTATKPIPIYIGGHTDVALRRAARHDGWWGAGPYDPEEVPPILDRLRAARIAAGTPSKDFPIILGLKTAPDLDTLRRLRDAGVTGINVVPWYFHGTPISTVTWKREQMQRFAEEFIEPLS